MSTPLSELIEAATKARNNAHAPYSGFKVGAAILTESGQVITGVNVENSSYPVSICAERTALAAAVAAGQTRFAEMVIVADSDDLTPPCGMCRQALIEFQPDLRITLANLSGKQTTVQLRELLPLPFGPGAP